MPTKTLLVRTADGQADAFAAYPDRGRSPPGGVAVHGRFRLAARAGAEGARTGRVRLLRARAQPLLPARPGADDRTPGPHRRGDPARDHRSVDAPARVRHRAGRRDRLLHRRRLCDAHRDSPPRSGGRPCRIPPGLPGHQGAGSPHRLVPRLTAQVHLGLAEGDMSPEAIRELGQALDAEGVSHTTEVYPGTLHGFTMADTDAFNSAALRRHWNRLFTLLDRTLKNV